MLVDAPRAGWVVDQLGEESVFERRPDGAVVVTLPVVNRAAFRTWVGLAAERGWAEYRAPAIFQDLISDTYSYNNHALRKLRESIKDAVDPNGILSPGRYGVWPKHLRKT